MANRAAILPLVAALALAFAAVTLLVAAQEPAGATFPGKNGRIAYDDGTNILSMAPDGSNPKQLTDGRDSPEGTVSPTGDEDPAYSPDATGGTKIAFTRCEPCSYPTWETDIWVKNLDTGVERRVSEAGDGNEDRRPAWSPDGSEIAFVRDHDSIMTMNPDGTGVRELVGGGDGGFLYTDLAWSPDGSEIAFETWGDNHLDVFVMNSDGTGARNLTDPDGLYRRRDAGDPNWSPDGTKIAFASKAGTQELGYDIWTMNADGTDKRNLTRSVGWEVEPVWSPNGRKIAYLRDRAEVENSTVYFVMKMNANGSSPVRLTDSPEYTVGMDWRPRPAALP